MTSFDQSLHEEKYNKLKFKKGNKQERYYIFLIAFRVFFFNLFFLCRTGVYYSRD
jgi:hypothetical protein